LFIILFFFSSSLIFRGLSNGQVPGSPSKFKVGQTGNSRKTGLVYLLEDSNLI
ncbi:GSCOCG00002077001-RA-CDS, partial [Cotesia congregata]